MLSPALQLTRWQGFEKRRCHTRAPLHRAEAPCGPSRSESRQAGDGRRATRDDDFLALLGALHEPRELCLSRVNGMSLLHTIHVSQRSLAKQLHAWAEGARARVDNSSIAASPTEPRGFSHARDRVNR